MEPLSPTFLWAFASAVFGGGTAYGVARSQLGQLEKDHEELKDEFVSHKKLDSEIHTDMVQRMARVETHCENILNELRRSR